MCSRSCLVIFLSVSCAFGANEPQKTDEAKAKAEKAAKAAENPIKKRIKADVDAMNDALIKNNLDKVLDLTHPRAIELAGGRKEMLSLLKKGVEEMKSKGIQVQSAESEEPSDPVTSGSDQFVVAPHTLVMKVPGGKLRAKGFVVGVSTDRGKSWKYVNGGSGLEAIKTIIPNIPDALKLPEETKPVFERE